ncbi:exopolysaccharide biosynthesis polyprenyl glycosylphosphotransferase [Actinomadura sp. J1-007]|nr:exopolysaccharide biosynthesis polyprenyl glycosylphosphotransferase [Actinomadura sp. J1-007]
MGRRGDRGDRRRPGGTGPRPRGRPVVPDEAYGGAPGAHRRRRAALAPDRRHSPTARRIRTYSHWPRRYRHFHCRTSGELPAELPVLGDCEDLSRILWDHGIGTVVVNAEEVERAWLDVIVRICFALRCETLLMLSPIDALSVDGARVEHLAGMPCVRLPRPRHEGLARHVKRAFDAAAALAALLLLLPVLAACALAVRLDTGPGVIFRQRRVGLDGREFVLLKFRTLLPADDHEADTRWSVDGDERLKPVGRFLRDTCLDELPQLWNVVRGDMSLVGPRPERPHFVRHFAGRCPGYTLRHRMRGGMTGWSQVHGLRGDTSIDLRARYDNHYIDGWSLGSDLKILLKTVRVVLLGNRR